MEESNSSANKSLQFLPPLKQSENQLSLTSKNPAYVTNNLTHEKELYELSLNKFEILTNQPKNVENCKLSSFSSQSFSKPRSQIARATPLLCKWDTNEMPKIKVIKIKNKPAAVLETDKERRMRLQFEQTGLLKKRDAERASRAMMAQQLSTAPPYSFQSQHAFPAGPHEDKWGSPEWADVQLRQQICHQFYDLDHRQMRFHRQTRPDFYEFTKNRNLENMLKTENCMATECTNKSN